MKVMCDCYEVLTCVVFWGSLICEELGLDNVIFELYVKRPFQ